jgi:nicotinate-nucleotide adenylyltransferase
MRLGLFGGTFDPIHYGHLILAECCRQQRQLDRVYFLPTAVPPHKQDRALTPGPTRIEMIELAIAGHEAFTVSPYEVEQGGVNYTVNTLTHFREQFPDAELFFLMGADMLDDLPNWRLAARVCELATPIVVRRCGTGEPRFECLSGAISPERVAQIRQHQVEMPEIGLSGTDLRRRVAAGHSIRYQTPRAVEAYIAAHGLYRSAGVAQPASGQPA